jgi:dipeptidase E
MLGNPDLPSVNLQLTFHETASIGPMDLLLLSSSRVAGHGYLDAYEAELAAFLGGRSRAAFLPYAGVTLGWDEYTAQVAGRLARMGCAVEGLHRASDPAAAIAAAEVVVVGGGNSFNLLKELQLRGLIAAIRARVAAGGRYLGWSAGSNVACPTIRTTNDMPIVEPASLDALGLVPFQINPHYTDAVAAGHMGETRDQRLAEFLVANPGVPVLGLREGSALRIRDGRTCLTGPHAAKLFRHGQAAIELPPGDLAL